LNTHVRATVIFRTQVMARGNWPLPLIPPDLNLALGKKVAQGETHSLLQITIVAERDLLPGKGQARGQARGQATPPPPILSPNTG